MPEDAWPAREERSGVIAAVALDSSWAFKQRYQKFQNAAFVFQSATGA